MHLDGRHGFVPDDEMMSLTDISMMVDGADGKETYKKGPALSQAFFDIIAFFINQSNTNLSDQLNHSSCLTTSLLVRFTPFELVMALSIDQQLTQNYRARRPPQGRRARQACRHWR